LNVPSIFPLGRGRDASCPAPPAQIRTCTFMHPAPTSGNWRRNLPYASQRLWHTFPVLSPARALLIRISLGPRPWLHWLRGGLLRVVRQLHSYYSGVRLPASVHHRLWSGRTMARCGLRMMPPFPSSPLRFRTAGFPSVRLQSWPVRWSLPWSRFG